MPHGLLVMNESGPPSRVKPSTRSVQITPPIRSLASSTTSSIGSRETSALARGSDEPRPARRAPSDHDNASDFSGGRRTLDQDQPLPLSHEPDCEFVLIAIRHDGLSADPSTNCTISLLGLMITRKTSDHERKKSAQVTGFWAGPWPRPQLQVYSMHTWYSSSLQLRSRWAALASTSRVTYRRLR